VSNFSLDELVKNLLRAAVEPPLTPEPASVAAIFRY
jgi:hypothetical protein